MKYNTIKEATEAWVTEMNAIPYALLQKAYPNMEEDGLEELTPFPMKWQCDTCNEEFSEEEVDELSTKNQNSYGDIICPTCIVKEADEMNEGLEEDIFTIDDCSAYIQQVEDFDNHEYGLPMWGWLWNPNESIDECWIKENLQIVADCGFRVYESDEVGILLGIDGAGYDFYEAHWIPLYKVRGLQWHKESGEFVE